ncbi:MAG: hypothetical protein IPL99_28175 [Candidatus Competibacteraceae bacterium]|nr:hypothetical protein [Candidatus Competibacteraceae bacterium]
MAIWATTYEEILELFPGKWRNPKGNRPEVSGHGSEVSGDRAVAERRRGGDLLSRLKPRPRTWEKSAIGCEFVEHMVMPTVVRLFQVQGLEVHEVHSDIKAKRGGLAHPGGCAAVSRRCLIAIECKSKMTTAQVDEHIQRMNKLLLMLPAYRHHQASSSGGRAGDAR